MYPWLVWLHVVGVVGFLMAHGISAGVSFALRRERNLERIQALLNLSAGTVGVLHGSILIFLASGVAAGFAGRHWGRAWIWVSLVLVILIYGYMNAAATRYYSRVRKAAGLRYMDGMKPHEAVEPASPEAIDALLNQPLPLVLAAAGFTTLAVVTFLMVFKPF